MNYGELRTYFKELLNRTDVTDTQVDLFITLGIRRTERTLRTGLQRKAETFTVPVGWNGEYPLPSDYLGFYFLKVNDLAVNRITVNAAGEGYPGCPQEFFIFSGSFHFRPLINAGDVISLGYYANFEQVSDPSVSTNYTSIIPDVIVYAALVYASDFFTDIRKGDFEASFQTIKEEYQLLSDLDEMSGGVYVSNPYEGIA